MSKPLFQDIIPPERRSIKHIQVPKHHGDEQSIPVRRDIPREPPAAPSRTPEHEMFIRRPTPVPPPAPTPVHVPPPERPRYEPHYEEHEPVRRSHVQPRRPNRLVPRVVITLVVIAVILGIGVWAMSQVTAATVTITPKQEAITVDASFSAQKQSADGLQFQIVTYAKDGKLAVASNGQEQAQTKASGIIIIYNSGASEQTLVANTRFQTDKGLIFRISQPITIPAATTENGKKVPGSVEAAVTADAIGPDYNVGLTDFTVPGLKGDPRYELVVARTKPQNPIQGGYNGLRSKVDEKELAAAREKVRSELKESLIKELSKYIPKDYIMPTNGYVILYESLPDIQEAAGLKINERATFHGYIFKKSDLAKALAEKVKGSASLPSEVSDVSKLDFAVQSPAKEPWNSSTIQFSLKGNTNLVATVDTDKLEQELLSKQRSSLEAILAAYPAVAKAEVTMRPFWKKSFPGSKDEITITLTNPQQ